MKVTVFVGPSLPPQHRARFPGEWFDIRPPAARGELAALTEAKSPAPAIVALIDGLMVGAYGPSIDETRILVESGHVVFGASSLGALRAAELCSHGMLGVGWVYKQFVSGALHRDSDLLAALYGDRSGIPLTVPQINIIYGLRELVRGGELSLRHAELLEEKLRRLTYLERSSNAIRDVVTSCGLSDKIYAYLVSDEANVKMKDALQCLHLISRFLRS